MQPCKDSREGVKPKRPSLHSKPHPKLLLNSFCDWAARILWTIILIEQLSKASGLDPLMDFTIISPDCNIIEAVFVETIQHKCIRKERDGVEIKHNCGCDDVYFYIIHAPQLANLDPFYENIGMGDNYQYDSRKDVVKRGVQNCNDANQSLPTWKEGDQTICWRPSVPGEEVSSAYRCGNDECIKVFSPMDDIPEEIDQVARGLWMTFGILFGLSFPVLAMATFVKTPTHT